MVKQMSFRIETCDILQLAIIIVCTPTLLPPLPPTRPSHSFRPLFFGFRVHRIGLEMIDGNSFLV